MTKIKTEGRSVVLRDSDGRIVKKTLRKESAVSLPKPWRQVLRELTGNGEDLHNVLYNIAMGEVFVPQHEGMQMEPQVPTFEVRRAAATDLLHMLHGKPVAQSEVTKAEEDNTALQQMGAMSDEQLWGIVHGKTQEMLNGSSTEGSDTEGLTSGEGDVLNVALEAEREG